MTQRGGESDLLGYLIWARQPDLVVVNKKKTKKKQVNQLYSGLDHFG